GAGSSRRPAPSRPPARGRPRPTGPWAAAAGSGSRLPRASSPPRRRRFSPLAGAKTPLPMQGNTIEYAPWDEASKPDAGIGSENWPRPDRRCRVGRTTFALACEVEAFMTPWVGSRMRRRGSRVIVVLGATLLLAVLAGARAEAQVARSDLYVTDG